MDVTHRIKGVILKEWEPRKDELGLKGLVDIAAKAATEAAEELSGQPAVATVITTEMVAGEAIAPGQIIHVDDDGTARPVDREPTLESEPESESDQPGGADALHEGLGEVHQHGPNAPAHEHDAPMSHGDGNGATPANTEDYLCPQCATRHKRESVRGRRHAHLVDGGPPAVVHNTSCPMGKPEPSGACTCGAGRLSPGERAGDRRET